MKRYLEMRQRDSQLIHTIRNRQYASRFKFHISHLVFSIFLPLFTILATSAQDLSINGFAQANYSGRVASTEDAPAGMTAKEKDLVLGDQRLQLEFSHFAEAGNASFSAKLDFVRDAIDSTMAIDIREAYLDLSLWKIDGRIGRQIVTWGLGDLVFINDLFPKDWVAFLSGQPLQYLKVGSDAINVSFHPGPLSAQLIVTPFFEPDNLPTGERLFFYNPIPPGQRAETVKPTLQFENFEVAGRIYRTVSPFDLSLYGYRGFGPSPAIKQIQTLGGARLQLFFPKLRVYGASAQGGFLGGIVSLEGGYYDSVEDRGGTDPFVDNPEIRFLMGYQRAFGADLTVGSQYYAEAMRKFNEYEVSLPTDFPKANRIRHNITLRVTQLLIPNLDQPATNTKKVSTITDPRKRVSSL